ncbi:esterase-like activity of phytase family protein [Saccharopolyspora sp. NFXS83]|uniref:esterase-like activity of phytase family protein n=1 Tax=Saccharopolyspora sp. NFXS83 TaxID=2993560 RepID=UPI00224A6D77|nr:esterase-like activity of phytase family protein [Saccharopolyspora sp. NFXS83]MCX2730660.1 esterase-like activity of phytase family protein [Saccharopolyspora sp. NFXS83]
MGLWYEHHPVPAGGSCSENATLLDHSDQLDESQVNGERVTGLSAFALTGRSKGYALADNEPGRVFLLELGDPEALDLSADTALTLRDPNGRPYGGVIDGEGLVVEPRTGTILLSSEKGPSIRRFQLSDGREAGSPLPIPEQLRTEPLGGAQQGRTIESLAATADGRNLYAGWEAPLNDDGDQRGRNRLRIQRYQGESGGTYIPDRQYAYETSAGTSLAELAVTGEDRLLALERQYVEGLGNTVRIFDIRLTDDKDITGGPALAEVPADVFVRSTLLFSLGDCPAGSPGQVVSRHEQPNPLLDNVEGMAVGPEETAGPQKGSRLLYLISDDNENNAQTTRFYTFRIRLPG